MKENRFQRKVIERVKAEYPGCVVLKNDAGYIQGFPDLTILYEDRWATLETKREKGASHQPNQDNYVKKLNAMSYSAFIYPENEEEVFDELERALRPEGGASARLPEPK